MCLNITPVYHVRSTTCDASPWVVRDNVLFVFLSDPAVRHWTQGLNFNKSGFLVYLKKKLELQRNIDYK